MFSLISLPHLAMYVNKISSIYLPIFDEISALTGKGSPDGTLSASGVLEREEKSEGVVLPKLKANGGLGNTLANVGALTEPVVVEEED